MVKQTVLEALGHPSQINPHEFFTKRPKKKALGI